ncbi:hypothetical protein GCM10010844_28680 [Deinococcus radiotolerans]|uniref:Uncharacterized protein n=1 Tax=Deinococcus radiotolerans TaxID=1309407 RepID=A0ABQ2FMN8_9DEIO|nr:hypothetical protein GCM10010844_28680 [Deinococcus radiotolerans]
MGLEDTQGVPLTAMPLSDVPYPLRRALTAQVVTATAAARRMIPARSAVT